MENWIENKLIEHYDNYNTGKTIGGINFRKCHFLGSKISYYKKPQKRTVVRDVQLIQCEITGCSITGVIVENVIVDGLKTHNDFDSWGAVFKHVVLKGRIGSVLISPLVYVFGNERKQKAFDVANKAYYEEIDWALDISEISLGAPITIRDIPSRLIRRDPALQAVVTLEKAKERKWETLDLSGTYWDGYIRSLLKDGWEDTILTVPKRAPKERYMKYLDGIKKLRDAGVAEPD